MWIDKRYFQDIAKRAYDERVQAGNWQADFAAANTKVALLERENERLRNDIKWFMHRLNQVEAERASMFFQATGTRIAAPQFKDPEQEKAEQLVTAEVLSALGAPFAGIGDDSPDPADQIPEHQDGSEDYSHLPGYRGKQ